MVLFPPGISTLCLAWRAYALKGVLEGKPKNREEVVQKITRGVIDRDYRFIVMKEGRPRSPLSSSKSPALDIWLSHFRHYALLGNPARLSEYDSMFRDVKVFWDNHRGEAFWNPTQTTISVNPGYRLGEVARVWEAKHAGISYFPNRS